MIQPQPAQRGVIGEQHGLQRLTETLDTLSKGQAVQQQRETQIQAQLTQQAQALTTLQTWHQRLGLAIGALGVLTLGLCGLMAWQMTHRPEMAYARALGALDATLGQTWGSLPKGVQEQFSSTYTRLGLMPPGQRK